jgi:hypothetical protein
MPVIDWSGFTWQVAATFFAAMCAIAIGLRQVGIAKRQAEIADGQRAIAAGQAETARLAIEIAKGQAATARIAQRSNLFDKRFEVYQAVQTYIAIALQQGGLVVRQGKNEFADDKGKIYVALQKARFLFSETARASIDDACALADEFAMAVAEIPLFPEFETKEQRSSRLHVKQMELIDVLRSLSDRMGDEMKLYME